MFSKYVGLVSYMLVTCLKHNMNMLITCKKHVIIMLGNLEDIQGRLVTFNEKLGTCRGHVSDMYGTCSWQLRDMLGIFNLSEIQ